MSIEKHTPTPQKLSAKWFEDFHLVNEDGEIEDWPEVARKLIEHIDACKIDEAQLESAGEEIERLRNSHDALVAVLERIRQHFPNLGQLLNKLEEEWKGQGCWSDWDASVMEEQRALHAALELAVKAAKGEA